METKLKCEVAGCTIANVIALFEIGTKAAPVKACQVCTQKHNDGLRAGLHKETAGEYDALVAAAAKATPAAANEAKSAKPAPAPAPAETAAS